MTSRVAVVDLESERAIALKEIETVIGRGGEREYLLKDEHAKTIVEYVAAVLAN
jgi:hypothetical protein